METVRGGQGDQEGDEGRHEVNSAIPEMSVNPETYAVHADGVLAETRTHDIAAQVTQIGLDTSVVTKYESSYWH